MLLNLCPFEFVLLNFVGIGIITSVLTYQKSFPMIDQNMVGFEGNFFVVPFVAQKTIR